MARSLPPNVIVLDSDALIHVRLGRGRTNPHIKQAKSYRLPAGTFAAAVVTPDLVNEDAVAGALASLREESGRWDQASLLLPDSWFRINIIDVPTLPEGKDEAEQMVRWSLKRTMPIDPGMLRLTFEILSRTDDVAKVLTMSAVDKTVTAIERLFSAAGIGLVLIEAIGINIWNAITVREAATTRDRLFFYVRDSDFTTAAFRGNQPLFIRSRNLNGERTLAQEIKLSASYLRDTLRTESIEACYMAGNRVDSSVASAITTAFGAPVQEVSLSDFSERVPEGIGDYEAELTACTGVFA
jgi:type IV pilus assembly protein PilM